MKGERLNEPVGALSSLHLEYLAYLQLHPEKRKRQREAALRRRFFIVVSVTCVVLLALARLASGR